jgi:hypothetical protein
VPSGVGPVTASVGAGAAQDAAGNGNVAAVALGRVFKVVAPDTAGVFDPSTAIWDLRNSNSPGAPDIAPFAYGAPGWLPVAGDWDGPALAQGAREGQDDSTAERQPAGRLRATSPQSALDRLFADSVLGDDLLTDGFAIA